MTASESKKNKRRKNKKGNKSTNPPQQPVQQPEVSSTRQEEIDEIQNLMDAEDDMQLPAHHIRGPRCLLCRKQKPPTLDDDEIDCDVESLSSLPLWVCADCRKKVEEDERRKTEQEEDERKAAELFFPSLPPEFHTRSSEPTTPNGSICTCQACTERRQIEGEHEKETQELQQCWIKLREIVRYVYRESVGGGSEGEENEIGANDVPKIKSMVGRLCTRDPHQLYQRLESQAREYVIEMKVRLLKQLTSGHKTPHQAKLFVAMLLKEYSNMCLSSKKVSAFFSQLETDHLKRFILTWAKHNKHLFQSIIYTDPLIQNSLPMLITQLRLGSAQSKEAPHEDSYPKILHRYLKFDDEMSEISVAWRDCQQLLEEYSEEQAALKAKQKMLKEDWEFFKAQRKLLEKKILKNSSKPSPVNNHCLETQFTETMRNLLQGSKTNKDEYPEHVVCPNCNRKRCPCDECTISHMITCGIISPEVQESMSAHSGDMPTFNHDSRYIIDITPPSMSSTGSSSGSSSPVPVDTEKLSLPFEDGSEPFDNEEAILRQIESDLSASCRENGFGGPAIVGSCCADNCQSSDDDPQVLERCSCVNCQAPAATTKTVQTEEIPCQCHACQKGMATSYLPPSMSPPPRPAALHLYPHIHGPNTSLHSMTAPHPVPRLNPQLYELHNTNVTSPVRPKPLPHPTKKPFNLDLDSAEALHEHIYHAYGEWENPIDNSFMLNAHKFAAGNMSNGSELLGSPPPLLSGKFFPEVSPLPKGVSQATKTAANFNLKPINRNLYPHSSQGLGGKTSCGSITSSDQCAKHNGSQLNSFANMHTHTSVSASSASTASLTAKLTPDLLRSAASKDSSNLLGTNSLNSITGLNLTQACSHFNPQPQHHPLPQHQQMALNQLSNKLPSPHHAQLPPAALNNAIPGCQDPECDGHHDDNYDDDSCSEQSSSASVSNQKDGKYCDCCYCEFFGHGAPAVAPTSRNFVEMRDKLRLQLKRKKEIKPDGMEPITDVIPVEVEEPPVPTSGDDPVWRMGLDELVKFINGEDEKKTAKTAKKARQKQKKAFEKARKLEDEQRRQEEQELRARAEEAERLRLQHLQQQHLRQQEHLRQQQQQKQESDNKNKKKKGKHKESPTRDSQEISEQNSSAKSAPANRQPSPSNGGSGKSTPDANCRNGSRHNQGKASPVQLQQNLQAPPRSPNVGDQRKKNKTGAAGPAPDAEVVNQNAKNANAKAQSKAAKGLENGRRIENMPDAARTPTQTRKQRGKEQNTNADKAKQDNTQSNTSRTSNQQNGKGKVDAPLTTATSQLSNPKAGSEASQRTPQKQTAPASQESDVSPKSGGDGSPQSGDSPGTPTPNKNRRKKRGKASEDIDEIFLPKQDLDLENGELDEFERELEEFKRFCFDSQPTQQRTKLAVNVNVKDMLLKKKVPTSVSCG